MENPVATGNASTHSLQHRVQHRAWILGRIATLLSHYWTDDDDEHLSTAIGADWADVLEGLPQAAIQAACINFQREEPRRRPTPAAIYHLAVAAIPRPVIVSRSDPEPQVERVSKEAANAIMEQYGFRPKKFGDQE